MSNVIRLLAPSPEAPPEPAPEERIAAHVTVESIRHSSKWSYTNADRRTHKVTVVEFQPNRIVFLFYGGAAERGRLLQLNLPDAAIEVINSALEAKRAKQQQRIAEMRHQQIQDMLRIFGSTSAAGLVAFRILKEMLSEYCAMKDREVGIQL
jgi:hypothetical protein